MTEIPDLSGLPEPIVEELLEETFEEFYDHLMEMTTDLTAEVQREWRKVKEDRTLTADVRSKLKSDLLHLLRVSKDSGGTIDEHRIQRAGDAGKYALDFGAARLEIGSRLARIRDASGAI